MSVSLRKKLTAAVLLSCALPHPAMAQPEPASTDWREFRGLFKELVETNTTLSAGSCTLAADRMAARLRAAGIPDSNLHLFSDPDHPKEGGLVAVYPGRDPKAKAVLLLAHLDVVEAKREDWERDPFTLVEENGYFYGRGTADDKAMAAIGVDNFIRFKREGFKPRRTLKLALTCGEEGAPFNGAKYLATSRRELIDAGFALNEGGYGQLDAAGRPLYQAIGVGEKFPQNFVIEAVNRGGHSSRPRADNAIYALTDALARIQAMRFPVRFNDTTRGFLSHMAETSPPEQQAAIRTLLANPGDESARATLEKNPDLNMILHTTCIPTMMDAGHAVNALPQRARVTLNCRLLPGDSVDGVKAALEAAVADPQISIVAQGGARTVAPAPPLDPRVLGPAEALAAKLWPGIPQLRMMLAGATDGGFLTAAGIPTYGIQGAFSEADGSGVHGLNERIRVKVLYDSRIYLYELMKTYGNQAD